MIRGRTRLRVPNTYQEYIGRGLPTSILHQASISREEWEKL
jgi:hypothetical protein